MHLDDVVFQPLPDGRIVHSRTVLSVGVAQYGGEWVVAMRLLVNGAKLEFRMTPREAEVLGGTLMDRAYRVSTGTIDEFPKTPGEETDASSEA